MDDTATLFELLAADYRRRILFVLCDRDPVQIPDGILHRGQASRHQQEPKSHSSSDDSSAPDEQTQRVVVKLQHVHLPKLEEAGVIEWNQDANTVSRGPRFEDIEPALCVLAENQSQFPDDLL